MRPLVAAQLLCRGGTGFFYQAASGVETNASRQMTFLRDGELSFALGVVFVVSIGARAPKSTA